MASVVTCASPVAQLRSPFRPVRHNDKYGRAMHAAHNLFQHFTGRRIDPVRILDDKEHRRDLRREQQPVRQRTDDEFLALLGGEVERLEFVADVEREELGIDRSDIRGIFPIALKNRAEFLGAHDLIVGWMKSLPAGLGAG